MFVFHMKGAYQGPAILAGERWKGEAEETIQRGPGSFHGALSQGTTEGAEAGSVSSQQRKQPLEVEFRKDN